MTDKEFYTALMYCFVEGKPHCTEYCPLIREINCRMRLRDEIRHRKCQAGKDEANGFRQLSLFAEAHAYIPIPGLKDRERK